MAVDIVHIVLNCFLTKVGRCVVEIQSQNLINKHASIIIFLSSFHPRYLCWCCLSVNVSTLIDVISCSLDELLNPVG